MLGHHFCPETIPTLPPWLQVLIVHWPLSPIVAFKSQNGGPFSKVGICYTGVWFHHHLSQRYWKSECRCIIKTVWACRYTCLHSVATSVSCQFIEDVKLQQHQDSNIKFCYIISCMKPSHIVLCLLTLMHGRNLHWAVIISSGSNFSLKMVWCVDIILLGLLQSCWQSLSFPLYINPTCYMSTMITQQLVI